MIKDFINYNPDNIIERNYKLTDDELTQLSQDVNTLNSFVRLEVRALWKTKAVTKNAVAVILKDAEEATFLDLKYL
jgi:AMMECR1 domain-containing protein